MLKYAKNYEDSKTQLLSKIVELEAKGYQVSREIYNVIDNLNIDKITIQSKLPTKNRLIFNIGLHGIEGYVGHACLMTFIDEYLDSLKEDTEVILYHPLNPFGMSNFRRNNENNVDLNRNFTTNNFSSENPGYDKAKSFFEPKTYKSKFTANLSFYSSLIGLIIKMGTSVVKEATLLGQKISKTGIYFSSNTHQKSTIYIMEQAKQNLKEIEQVVWIDLHTGYGPRYQMSIVNSKYEKTSTKDIISNIDYPLVLGLNADDFYEIDGDMIEMIYRINEESNNPTNLYATCFEFGTLGEKTFETIESLKAIMFENSNFFNKQSSLFNEYSRKLIKEQFLPSASEWKKKAHVDFKRAMEGILKYKHLIKE
jgi:hypothetical protein